MSRRRAVAVGPSRPAALACLFALGTYAGAAAGQDRSLPSGALEAGHSVESMLSVASYNVQFVTPDVPLLSLILREFRGHKPNVEARARAIGERLACSDLVALQETINDARRAELLAQLQASGRDCGKPSRLASGRMFEIVEGPPAPTEELLPLFGNELTLASRLPVLETDELVYQDAAEEDRLAAKGALFARLARGEDGSLDVYVTHLQAGAQEGTIRRAQIAELAAFVRERSGRDPAVPILIAGDFNTQGGAAERATAGSDYRRLVGQLAAAVAPRRLLDLWLVTHPGAPDRGGETKPRQPWKQVLQRIDYLFLATSGRARPLRMGRTFLPSDLAVDGRPLGHLSDHAALLAEIGWAAARVAMGPERRTAMTHGVDQVSPAP